VSDQEQERKDAELASIEEAKAKGLFRVSEARSAVKLARECPKIAIAIPMGDKDDPDMHTCEACGHRHFGLVKCEQCGSEQVARFRLRHAGLVPIEWVMNEKSILPPLLTSIVFLVRKSVLSAQARQEMTREAVNIGCDYIFYWDDDTLIPPKAIYDMHRALEMNPDVGIITGVYTTREQMNEPILYKRHGDGAYWGFSTAEGVLEDVFAAGAGCMMARVSALKEVEEVLGGPWWLDEHDPASFLGKGHRIIWGHDIRFCRRMHELRESGKASQPWRVVVAGWIMCGHFDISEQKIYDLPEDAPCFKDTNTRSYWDHIWFQERGGRDYGPLYEKVAEMVPEGANVVDFGCGPGFLLDYLTKKKRIRGYGYDLSQEAIEQLEGRWLEGEVMDALDFKANHFDPSETVFVCTETLEHLDDTRYENILSEMGKCKMAVVTVPNGNLPGTPAGEHQREFTSDSFATELGRFFGKVEIVIMQGGKRMVACATEPRGVLDEHDQGSDLVSVAGDDTLLHDGLCDGEHAQEVVHIGQ
jgi:hypothetical protein